MNTQLKGGDPTVMSVASQVGFQQCTSNRQPYQTVPLFFVRTYDRGNRYSCHVWLLCSYNMNGTMPILSYLY